MDNYSIGILMMGWQDKIPQDSIPTLQEQLSQTCEDKMPMLTAIQLKNPLIGLLLGLFLGAWGADRFYKGDYLLGGIKLMMFVIYLTMIITGGLKLSYEVIVLAVICAIALCIWNIIDLFLVWKGIKKDNFEKIQNTL